MNKNLILVMIISIIIGSVIGSIIGSIATYNLLSKNGPSKTTQNQQVQKVVYQQNVVIKEADEKTFVNVIEKVRESVARIDIVASGTPWSKEWDDVFKYFFGKDWEKMFKNQGLGSGFIIDNNKKFLITNNHVIEKAQEIYITFPGNPKKYLATVVGADKYTDLALLKIDTQDNFKPLEFENSDEVKIGEWVIAVGNPYGFDYSATVGVISAKNRSLEVQGLYLEDLIQTDAPINPGNSGGPLIDLNSKVVGVNTAVVITAQGLGFAIPSNKVKKVISDLEKYGKVIRPYIGIQVTDLTPEIIRFLGLANTKGVIVEEVEVDSPAYKMEIKKGDIITAINNEIINNTVDYNKVIEKYTPGQIIRLHILRLNKKLTKDIKLEAR
ncbi:MAG: trypsin-like peptidase domain-containing protein [Candidatus Calescibacterium sp.]|nr:trypsin-like peptidase domain-containing protein [Candidatus Calescibacterium sp.]MDW8132528.1 trypsin-like peptidase domain-containing protein [Candidatus Calescibacterium sp.]